MVRSEQNFNKKEFYQASPSRYIEGESDSASSSFSSTTSSSSEFDSTDFENNNWNFIERDLDYPALQTEMESIQVVEGYLDRNESSGLFPKWTRSFCRLCGNKIFFSDENLIVIDYINLLDIKQVHWGSTNSLKFSLEDYSGHKYTLRAESETLKLYWTVKIRSVARFLQKELSMESINKPKGCSRMKNLLPVS